MALLSDWRTVANVAFPDVSTALNASKSELWLTQSILTGNSTGTNGPAGAPAAGAFWTHYASSDAVTAGIDATNRWLAAFNAAKIVRAAAGTAHSWIVLKSPTGLGGNGPYYLCLDFSSTGDALINIAVSKAAPTGGSITARPTATDEWTYTGMSLNDASAVNHKMHVCIDVNGNFYLVTSKDSSARWFFGLAMVTLLDLRPGGDAYPVVSICDYNGNSGAGLTGPFHMGGSNFSALSSAAAIRGRTPSGGASVLMAALDYRAAGTSYSAQQTASNAADSKWDELPVFVWIETAGQLGIKGRIPDLGYVGSGFGQGTLTPTGATPERACVGTSLIPISAAMAA